MGGGREQQQIFNERKGRMQLRERGEISEISEGSEGGEEGRDAAGRARQERLEL